jgi:hypothetical protein
MTEHERYEKENDDMIDFDSESPLLCKYIDDFLRFCKTASEHKDSRVLLYRGQSDKEYSLMPSVFRKGLLRKEHTLIHELLLKMPEGFSSNSFERLIKMQHYGLPTRVMDFSTNPLIALYFACLTDQDRDGEIVVLYDYIERYDSREVLTLATLSEFQGAKAKDIVEFLADRNIQYNYEAISDSSPELEKVLNRQYIPVAAPLNNERIKRQHGVLVIFGFCGKGSKNIYQKGAFDLKSVVVADVGDGIDRSIIIPLGEKKQLLWELDAIGINESFLFPELEHQATYIKQKFEEA